jgi:uncharacterized protein (DUF2267 family)
LSRLTVAIALSLVALPSLAGAADQAAAQACSANLPKDAQGIYAKVAPTVTPKTDLRDAVTSVVRPMVMNGSMSRDAARTAAEQAGACLEHLK